MRDYDTGQARDNQFRHAIQIEVGADNLCNDADVRLQPRGAGKSTRAVVNEYFSRTVRQSSCGDVEVTVAIPVEQGNGIGASRRSKAGSRCRKCAVTVVEVHDCLCACGGDVDLTVTVEVAGINIRTRKVDYLCRPFAEFGDNLCACEVRVVVGPPVVRGQDAQYRIIAGVVLNALDRVRHSCSRCQPHDIARHCR